MRHDLSSLNEQFAINGTLSFSDHDNGFLVAEISNDHCSASIALNGAHLLAWQPAGAEPVIWMSEDAQFSNGKSIRGGIPVCWPWFGAHPVEPSYPAHGFARTAIWEVFATESHEDGSSSISLKLEVPAGYPLWPFATRCELVVRCGTSLEMTLTTHNSGSEALIIGQALHTYFNIGDIHQTYVQGLNGRDYLDKPSNFARMQQHGDITFEGEVDRIYFNTPDACLINDPVLERTIRIEKSGSNSTVVWNPWKQRAAEMGDLGATGWKTMLCVESSNAAQDVVSIASGASHTLGVRYCLAPLSTK